MYKPDTDVQIRNFKSKLGRWINQDVKDKLS